MALPRLISRFGYTGPGGNGSSVDRTVSVLAKPGAVLSGESQRTDCHASGSHPRAAATVGCHNCRQAVPPIRSTLAAGS